MQNEVMVSICCITYNHAKYIRQALDGFLMQKTNFKYEILIHDDASTDETADIIREYENKYPDIIKPIYQTVNQYSQGIKLSKYNYERVKGKYIAECEGDDYWCDENKLQKQVDYMEKNPECSFCFHNAYILDNKKGKYKKFISKNRKFYKKSNTYTMGELELLQFIPTASFLYRSENFKKMPDWFYEYNISDLPLKLIMTSFGYAYYVDEIMSVYRTNIGASATDTIKNDRIKNLQHWENVKNIINDIDSYTNRKYSKELDISRKYIDINILKAQERYKEIIKNKSYRRLLTYKENIKIVIKIVSPKLYTYLKKIKNGRKR